ncbi:ribonuclease E activity regulator RraA [Corynebacterium lubricantis]|uniref:ribonuclease E activity regulator RraA n=1 Tax=Corynebacterium lubricantis TaxID=541095 RepID=UPI0003735A61|nr:ribonuclease E activity regulator RraA [Corynebacterium lubricantis]
MTDNNTENQTATCDIADLYGDKVQSCDTQFFNYGGKTSFCGEISTIICFQDNGLVKKVLNSPKKNGVLVIDGHASMHTALMGDMIAQAAIDNGWNGVIINGPVRDRATLAKMDLGVKALGSNPRKSAKDGVGTVDAPAAFGGVTFHPGHYVYADVDGVVVTPEPVAMD